MNSASAATSVRMCCASISTASDGPDTSVDVVAANVPPPCSKGRNGPMNTSACRSAPGADGEIAITYLAECVCVCLLLPLAPPHSAGLLVERTPDIESGTPRDRDPSPIQVRSVTAADSASLRQR